MSGPRIPTTPGPRGDTHPCGLRCVAAVSTALPRHRPPPPGCCLDVCAAPGSKTMQLLEAVARGGAGGGGGGGGGGSGGGGCAGLVVANDAHPKRVAALEAALARQGRCAEERAVLLVTCHRGEALPSPARPFLAGQGAGCGRMPRHFPDLSWTLSWTLSPRRGVRPRAGGCAVLGRRDHPQGPVGAASLVSLRLEPDPRHSARDRLEGGAAATGGRRAGVLDLLAQPGRGRGGGGGAAAMRGERRHERARSSPRCEPET